MTLERTLPSSQYLAIGPDPEPA